MPKKKTPTSHAIHPSNKIIDVQTVSVITWLISRTKRAVPDFKAYDSWPNLDGTIDLLEINIKPKNKVIGFLTVQIKKLKNGQKTPSYNFKDYKFLNYCKDHGDVYPIIFIGVTLDQKKPIAYWEHIDSSYLKKLGTNQTINFDANKVIDDTSDKFVDDWINIYTKYKDRFSNYLKLKQSYDTLIALVPDDYGKTDPVFIRIHEFLDEYNNLLDNQFKIIKSRFFPFAWKIGLAYRNYSPSDITYALYPIPINKNDIQIKKIDNHTAQIIRKEAYSITSIFDNNPIEKEPKGYANQIIIEDLQKLIEGKFLNNSVHDYLAKEYIFAFIDNYYRQLGLGQKDKYTLEEITFAFYKYLPAWVSESIIVITSNKNETKETLTTRNGYFDPSILISYLSFEQLEEISKKLKEINLVDLQRNEYLPLGSNKLGFGMFVEMLDYMRNNYNDETVINRIYKKRKTYSSRIDKYTIEDLKFNIQTFFQSLPEVYNDFINANFPLLEKDFSLFNKATSLVYSINLTSHGNYDHSILLLLKSEIEKKAKKTYVFFDNKNFQVYQEALFKQKTIFLDNIPHTVIKRLDSGRHIIQSDTPMLDFIYDQLKERVDNYYQK